MPRTPQTLSPTHPPIVREAVGTPLCEASVDMNQDSCERLQGNSPQMVEGEKLQRAVWLLKNRRRRRRGRSRSDCDDAMLEIILSSVLIRLHGDSDVFADAMSPPAGRSIGRVVNNTVDIERLKRRFFCCCR